MEAQQFANIWFGEEAEGNVVFGVFPSGGDNTTRACLVDDVEIILSQLAQRYPTESIYYSVCLHKGKSRKAECVTTVPGVWLEIDTMNGDHKKGNLPANQQEAFDLIKRVYEELPPSMVLDSGGGIHVYWKFDEPFVIRNEKDRKTITRIVDQFEKAYHEYHVKQFRFDVPDKVGDLARILRLPGTINHKYNRKVTYIKPFDDEVYTLDEICEFTEKLASETPKKNANLETCPNQICDECPFMRHWRDDAATLDEPSWHAGISVLARDDVKDYERFIHEVSSEYPGYSPSETSKKIIETKKRSGPMTCAKISDITANRFCGTCAHQGRVKSPITLGGVPNTISEASFQMPNGYKLIGEKIFEIRVNKNDVKYIPVSDCPIAVTSKHLNITDGTHGVDVSWMNGKQIQVLSNSRSTFMNSQKIIHLSDFGLPVHSGNARALTTFLSRFENDYGHLIPNTTITNQMGWLNDSFLLGEELVGGSDNVKFVPFDAGEAQLAVGFGQVGSMDQSRAVLEQIKPYLPVKLTIYAAMAAPLLRMFGESSFIFELAGGTSKGKTTALRIAASLIGSPDESKPGFFKQWNMTKIFLERYAATMNHLPLFIDDTKKGDPLIIPTAVYQFCSGQGRGRGSLKGSQVGASWNTVMLSTGEQPLTSFSKDGGSVGRVLSLHGSPFDETSYDTGTLIEEINRTCSQHYGHFIRPWIVYIQSMDRSQWMEQLKAFCDEYRSMVMHRGEVAMRLSRIMGILQVTAMMFDDCFGLELFDENEFKSFWRGFFIGKTDTDRSQEAMEDALSWVTSFRHHFISEFNPIDHKVIYGRIKRNVEIEILPSQLNPYLESRGYEPISTAKGWKDKGWLKTYDGRIKKKARIIDEPIWVYCFNLERIQRDLSLHAEDID